MKISRLFVLMALFAMMSTQYCGAQVLINEFMASNTSIYPDMCDYDDFSDWIELCNTTDAEISLDGYYLTDNMNNRTKWPIPQGTVIAAKGFLVILADGEDKKPGVADTLDSYPWNVKFTTKRYHANFTLSDDGEEIGLFRTADAGTVLVDSVIFSNQRADISLGRSPADNKWYRFDLPTPGAANTSDPKSTETVSGSVTFSIEGGFYDAAQTLTMTAASGDIHYTTDGSIPNKNSTKYSSALTIDKTVVIRARCIETSNLAGKVTTATYFINEPKRSMMMISITADTSLLYSEELGVFENSWKNREVPISMEFFTPQGSQVIKVNAGMTLGSLTNFTCPQKPLQIALKGGKYGDDFIWYRLFSKQTACFARIRLRQGGDGWESNLISDGMLEAMSRDQLSFGIQAYRPVVVFINGRYYGVHDLREQFDDQYFINNFGVDPTTKDEVKTTLAPFGRQVNEVWELESGTWDNYRALMSLVKDGEMTSEKYQQVASLVDINSKVDFVSSVVFGNQISWGHNEDIWKINNSKWRWLVTDFDRCFVYSDKYADYTHNNFTTGAGASGSLMAQDTLFARLLEHGDFKNFFVQRFAAHLNSTFKPSRMKGIADSLAAVLRPEMEEYTAKWGPEGGIASVTAWEAVIDSLKMFLDARPEVVFGFFSEAPFNFDGTAALSIALQKPDAGEVFINGVRMCAGLDSLVFVKGVPFDVEVVAKPGYVFAGWEDVASIEKRTLTLAEDMTITAKFDSSTNHPLPTEISTNTTLNLTDNPYIATGNIVISKGAALTIEKGVTLLMPQDADILVRGRLLINGAADAEVTIKENSLAGASNWGAINFEDALDTNTLNWLKISGATLGDDPLDNRAAINGNRSNVVLDHITMQNVVYPIYFEYGSVTLRNSHITIDHICNGGIHAGRGAATVENNVWISTGVTMNTDAIDIKGVENGVVRGNIVYNFNGFNSDAIDLGEGAKNILIEGNIVYGSYDKGISIGGKSTAIVRDNLLFECDLGIGIKDEGSSAELDHNTFVRNRIGIAAYSKVYGRGGGVATVKNCIISSSKSSSFFADMNSSVTISYSISDADVLPGTGNILAEPLFTDQANNNFQLLSNSPCINSGDPSSQPDNDNSVTDIGARYTFGNLDRIVSMAPAVKAPEVVISELMYNDDDKSPSDDWIEFHNPSGEEISLAGWKLTDEGDYTNWEKSVDIAEIDSSDVFYFPADARIPAGGFLVVCIDTTAFKYAYPQVTAFIGGLPFGLNGTETVLLYNKKDSLINAVSFDNVSPWPKKPDGKGPSLELSNLTWLNYHPINWKASQIDGGTPGAANTASPVIRPQSKIMPVTWRLAQNFPNPCKTSTTIKFSMPVSDHVKISVYNLSGRLIETPLCGRVTAGTHSIGLDTRRYSAGVYFYRIKAGNFMQTRKLTVQ